MAKQKVLFLFGQLVITHLGNLVENAVNALLPGLLFGIEFLIGLTAARRSILGDAAVHRLKALSPCSLLALGLARTSLLAFCIPRPPCGQPIEQPLKSVYLGEAQAALYELLLAGKIDPNIMNRLPFDQFMEGIKMLEERKIVGKSVLII